MGTTVPSLIHMYTAVFKMAANSLVMFFFGFLIVLVLVFNPLFTQNPSRCLHHGRSYFTKTLAIQEWVDGGVHKHNSGSQVKLYLPADV